MKRSKTTIKKRIGKKTNPELVETVKLIRKNSSWNNLGIAEHLSSSSRKMPEVNLAKIELHSEQGDNIIIPGKVLGAGSINKKIKVCAFKFSKEALTKLKDKKCDVLTISEEINKNPKATGLRVLI